MASVLLVYWVIGLVSIAEAPDDVLIAIGTGMGTAVLSVWVTIAVRVAYGALFPRSDVQTPPQNLWVFLVPPVVFGIFALITGFVGALIGALLAKHLRWSYRQRHPGPTSVS